jgi:hypothetical protein
MAPLTIAPHTVTAPRATVASALHLLDHARLGWRCNREAGQSRCRCGGSPKKQHGAADQPGGHGSHLKSTHVILLCLSARCTIDATDPLFRRGEWALSRLVRRAIEWMAERSH